MGTNLRLERALKVVHAVMQGKALDRRAVADMLQTNPAAADTTMRTLRKVIPGLSISRGLLSCDARYRLGAPNDVMVLAGSMALSLSRLFGSSPQAVSMTKLLDRMMKSARKRISEVDRKFFFVERGGEVAFEKPTGIFDELSQAVRDSLETTITYTHNDGKEDVIRIQPLTILVFEHQLYVMGSPCAGGAPYPYRVARISQVELSEQTFQYPVPDDYDPATVFKPVLGIHVSSKDPVEEIRVRLTGGWARYAQSHRWHKSQEVTPDGDGAIVTLRVRLCPEVETWVLGFGEYAEVLAPTRLRKKITGRLSAAQSTYDQKPAKSSRRTRSRSASSNG